MPLISPQSAQGENPTLIYMADNVRLQHPFSNPPGIELLKTENSNSHLVGPKI